MSSLFRLEKSARHPPEAVARSASARAHVNLSCPRLGRWTQTEASVDVDVATANTACVICLHSEMDLMNMCPSSTLRAFSRIRD